MTADELVRAWPADDDWIIQHPDGRIEILTDAEFRARYEAAEDTAMPAAEVKPGYRTTEFWATIAATLVMVAQAFGVEMDAEATVGVVVAVASYVLSRGWAKR